jgi:hypothetical protein
MGVQFQLIQQSTSVVHWHEIACTAAQFEAKGGAGRQGRADGGGCMDELRCSSIRRCCCIKESISAR